MAGLPSPHPTSVVPFLDSPGVVAFAPPGVQTVPLERCTSRNVRLCLSRVRGPLPVSQTLNRPSSPFTRENIRGRAPPGASCNSRRRVEAENQEFDAWFRVMESWGGMSAGWSRCSWRYLGVGNSWRWMATPFT